MPKLQGFALSWLVLAVVACSGKDGAMSDPCHGVTCTGNGVCLVEGGSPYCACFRGFHPEGLACVENDPVDPCRGVDCSGHGICRLEASYPVCDCNPGYRRPSWSELVCLPVPGGADGGDVDPGGFAFCGDRTVQRGEDCDDGNDTPGDGCEPDCRFSCRSATECDDNNPCTVERCEVVPNGQVCSRTVAPGTVCDDNNMCTHTDRCNADGTCAGTPYACLVGVCQHASRCDGTGGCTATWSPFGTPCDDGNRCTSGDRCDGAGRCIPGPNTCGCPGGTNAECARFEDGNRCNGTLRCVNLMCEVDPATVVTCPPDRPCARYTCDPADGTCRPSNLPAGTPCSDGLWCNGAEVCDGAGNCAPGPPPCPVAGCVGGCDEVADRCIPAPAGTVCTPGVGSCAADAVCDGTSTACPGAGLRPAGFVCRPAIPGGCDVAETCTGSSPACPDDAVQPAGTLCRAGAGVCDPPETCSGTSATCPPNAYAPAGTPCDDGNPSTTSDTCTGAGACVGREGPAPSPPAPATLFPENGALTGSFRAPASFNTLRPLFRWHPPPDDGSGAVTYDIQVDDSCTTPGFASCTFPSPEASASGLAVPAWRPSSDLAVSTVQPVGRRYYWRVRSCRGQTCSAWSPVRYLDVGRAPKDFNGDGYSDVIVGAHYQDAPAANEGNAFVYHGGPTGIPATPTRILDNPANQAGGYFGYSVASAGDVNADGYADVVVGARGQSAGAMREGNAFVYHGGPAGIQATPTTILDNPANQANGHFGNSVASAGDVNGDGYADVIIGADFQDAGADNEGNAFVYHGGPTGIATTPATTLDNPANQFNSYFGTSVASAGDVNGDGYADVIVGAHQFRAGANYEGNAFVYHGGPTGIPPTPATTLDNPANQTSGYFGVSVASAGDVNGDGYADVIVGARGQFVGGTREGSAFIYHGSATGVPTTPTTTLDNPTDEGGSEFGRSVASAGDVNGDGYADVIVGANYQDAGARDEGNAFVYHGSPAGITTTPARTLDNPANEAGGRFGISVASAGDANGDGYADVIVGAHEQDAGAQREGNAFVYHGASAGVPPTPNTTLDNPVNQAAAEFGLSVAFRSEGTGVPRWLVG